MIIRNSARCLSCGDEVESRHRHDYATCSCGSLSVAVIPDADIRAAVGKVLGKIAPPEESP